MILKSFLLEKNLPLIDNYNQFYFMVRIYLKMNLT